MKRAAEALAALSLVLAVHATADAQGKSGSAPGQNKNKGGGSAAAASGALSTSTETTAASSSGNNLYFGSWLDDASVLPQRSAWVGFSTAYWKADAARQIDSPVLMAAASIAPHVQLGGSLPIYHFRAVDGTTAGGVGTISVYGKAQLVDPGSNQRMFGVAVTPLLEISDASDPRVGLAMPLNVETRFGSSRVYGSVGYFSRGSVFTTAAAERPIGHRAAFSVNIGRSYSSGFRRTDIGAGIALFASAGSTVFASLGRSFGPDADAGSSGISFGGGISFLLPHR